MAEERNANTSDLEGQLRFLQGCHDWIYGEKQRLETALNRIAKCGPEVTRDELILIAKNNLPVRQSAPELDGLAR